MFVPGWLLFIGVVVALLAFKRLRMAARAVLGWAILISVGLLLLASVGFGIYFAVTGKFGLALLVGSPILGLVIWGLAVSARSIRDDKGQLKAETLRSCLRKHNGKVDRDKNPASVIEARLALGRDLNLCQTLLCFYEHVANYPAWYAQPCDQERSWCSSVIPGDSIRVEIVSNLKHIGLVLPDAEEGECLTYVFSAAGKRHVFCGHTEAVPKVTFEAAPGWTLEAARVAVVALPNTVVLDATIICETTATDFRYRHGSINAFRPDEWLVELLSVADGVEVEYDARLRADLLMRDEVLARRFA